MVSANAMARQQLKALEANNLALANMQAQFEKLTKAQEKQTRAQRKHTKAVKAAKDAEDELDKSYERKSKAITESIKAMNKRGKAFELLSRESYKTYINHDKFTNTFEYLDMLLTGTSEQIKLFGFEVANVRKVMYGFLPPGMFRMVNKLSTGLRFLGNMTRKMKEEGEEANNIFTTMGKVFKKIPKAPSLDAIKKINLKDIKSGPAARMVGAIGKAFTPVQRRRMAGFTKAQKSRKGQFAKGFEPAIVHAIKKKFFLLANGVIPFIKQASKALYVVMFYIGLIVVVVTTLKTIFADVIQPVWDTVKEGLGIVMSGFSSIWEGITQIWDGVMSGDILGAMEGVFEVLWGMAKIVFGLAYIAIGGFVSLIVNMAIGLWDKFGKMLENIKKNPGRWFKKNIGKILLFAGLIVAFLYGLPIMLPLIVIGVLWAFGRWIVKKLSSIIPGMANGGVSAGGLTVVGEKGPELVNLPRNSRVHSNKDSRKMVSSGGGNTINVTVNATSTNDTELRRIAQKVAQMINREVNRTTSSSMSR